MYFTYTILFLFVNTWQMYDFIVSYSMYIEQSPILVKEY